MSSEFLSQEELDALPPQLRAQFEQQADPGTPDPVTPDTAPEPPVEPAVPEETPPIAPHEPSEAPSQAAPIAEPDPFEHKFRVIQGKYDKEVPRLHEELAEAKKKIESLQAQIPPPPAKERFELDDEEEERFGELIPTTVKVVEKMIEPFKEQARNQEEQVRTAQGRAETAFLNGLNALDPDWRTKWNDPGFHSSLTPEQKAAIAEADANLDPAPIAAIMKSYHLRSAAPIPAAPEILRQTVPAPSAAPVPAEPVQLTPAEIRQKVYEIAKLAGSIPDAEYDRRMKLVLGG